MQPRPGNLATAALLSALFGSMWPASAAAQSNRLSEIELERCAGQALQLRNESARLHEELTRLDGEREKINQRSASLDAQAQGADRAKLQEIYRARLRHNDAVVAFNEQIEDLRADIVAINEVKQDYATHCSGRPYRRADLDELPPAEQEAMRAGLNEVFVPYLDPAAAN